ncbi:hypothetical protein [Tahibacter amnicola]|uniref:Uncharacterized protein n=1 Tax=Tahibacter amnicola TaxID=2976241 RepID=A0ABY6B815_9GAMM|nr:hypothetical protein [Tahibacter amnicola]UXI66029.1 hypothetical protein N4264_14850 [Tahibacter amnicola]
MALDRMAFAGTAHARAANGEKIHVQALCWPVIATAWHTLSQAWSAVRAERGTPPHSSSGTSWLKERAPQLAEPFWSTTAEESSVAALVARTPVEIAIVVLRERVSEGGEPGVGPTIAWQALANSLLAYDQVARTPGRQPCTVLVTANPGTRSEQQAMGEYVRARTRLPDATWIRDLQLRFWEEPADPLPLQLANVAAEAVARYLLDEKAVNPVFAAVESKLAHAPFPLRHHVKAGRR